MNPTHVNQLVKGMLAGTIATVPMTAVMQLLHQWPFPERDSLPPHQITKRVVAELGINKYFNQQQLKTMTIVNHYGFGALMGGLYSVCTSGINVSPVVKGVLWGGLVWSLSYLGWLPASHILPPATENSNRRNFLMIASHFVWGVSTALLIKPKT